MKLSVAVLVAALTLGLAWNVPCSAQSSPAEAAAILARVDSPANWTNRVRFEPGTITIVDTPATDGPYGPFLSTPIDPLSRQPYGYWPQLYGWTPWIGTRRPLANVMRPAAPMSRPSTAAAASSRHPGSSASAARAAGTPRR